jgi:hypothetical protein
MGPRTPFWRSHLNTVAAVAVALCSAALAGCSPKIGDHCVLNTDCGSSGTLVCDTSLPNGYCTQFNCTANACQNSAACVAFQPAVPGCPYDDYHSPARTTRTFCMEQCHADSDCRQGDGYICANPRKPPWNAAVIDDNQGQEVCIPGYSSSTSSSTSGSATLPDGSVCGPSGPVFEGGPGESDATGPSDDASDAAEEGSVTSTDGAGVSDGEAGVDSGVDSAVDSSALDAPGADAADAGASDAQDEG